MACDVVACGQTHRRRPSRRRRRLTRFIVACVVLVGADACSQRQQTQDAPPPDAFEGEDPAQYPNEPFVPEETVIEAEPEYSVMERDLMLWQVSRIARGAAVATDAQVRIEKGIRLEVRQQSRWQAATLDDLAAHLDRAKELFAAKRRAQGKSGYDSGPTGQRASGLLVGLELHPGSPWQHFGWLLTVCMEQRIYKLQVRVGDRILHLFLFWDAAIEWTSPPPLIRAKVHVEAKAAEVSFRIDGEESHDLTGVTAALEKARQRAAAVKKEDFLVGVPVVPPEVSVAHVLDLFFAFLDARIPRLDFMNEIPRQPDRKVDVLPAPVKKRR